MKKINNSEISLGKVYIFYNKLFPEYFFLGRSFKPNQTLIGYSLSFIFGFLRFKIKILKSIISRNKKSEREKRLHSVKIDYLSNFLRIFLAYGTNHTHLQILDYAKTPEELERKYVLWKKSLKAICYEREIRSMTTTQYEKTEEIIDEERQIVIKKTKIKNKYHSTSITYFIHHIDGRPPERISSLYKFCEINNLHYETLRRTRSPEKNNYRPHHKGFYIRNDFTR